MIMKVNWEAFKRADWQSPWFRDALMDLPPSAARVVLRLQPGEGNERERKRSARFSLYAEGDFGTVQVSP